MTNAEKIARFIALVEKRKHDGTHTPEKAMALLIEEGIYDKNGNLTPEYGGPTPKAA